MEAVLKIFAMSKNYFLSGWNDFDLAMVALSIIDVGVQNINGLSVFRAFRLVSRMIRFIFLPPAIFVVCPRCRSSTVEPRDAVRCVRTAMTV